MYAMFSILLIFSFRLEYEFLEDVVVARDDTAQTSVP